MSFSFALQINDQFLYDRELRHERVKEKLFFLLSGFLFTDLLVCYKTYKFFFAEYPGG